MKRYDKDFPVVLGICGQAASGKTSVANYLVPEQQVRENEAVILDHKFLAMPLYSMVAIKRKTKGEFERDRQLYLMHELLVDLFGTSPLYGAPRYQDLVDLTHKLVQMPIEVNEDTKPREFLQTAGSMCRELDPDCFVGWIHRAILKDFMRAKEIDKEYICIVSDVRMPNEAKFIAEHRNGTLVKFKVSPRVAEERLLERDGFLLTEKQANHMSERIDDIPADYIAATIDSDNLSIAEQAAETVEAMKNHVFDVLSIPLYYGAVNA